MADFGHGADTLPNPALSFSRNPEFKKLVEAVTSAKKVTIICGAGVSIDAGLPDWHGLLRNIAKRKKEHGDDLAGITLGNESDLVRAAGLLIRHRKAGGHAPVPDYSLISEALYGDLDGGLPPSYLAQQISKFALAIFTLARPGDVAIVSFNFDDVLETAMDVDFAAVEPCSLDNVQEWWDAFDNPAPGPFRVLHLHGYYGRDPNQLPLGPVLLTEDQFYAHGHRVQDNIRKVLDKSDLVIALGVSMNDPNLVAALTDRSDNHNVYVTSVPGQIREVDPADPEAPSRSEDLTKRRNKYTSDLLQLNTVELNSYAQLHQLMIELELAATKPKQYARTATSSARYGYRLSKVLKTAYRHLGYPPMGREATWDHLLEASDGLSGVLKSLQRTLVQQVIDEEGPEVRTLMRSLDESEDVPKHLRKEGLALFLWLPARFDPNDKATPRPYRLHLVGSSAYVHRDYWSFKRAADISAYGTSAHVRAAFKGQPVIEECVDHELWSAKTNVAVPLAFIDSQYQTTVSAGVAVLASDRSLVTDDKRLKERAAIGLLSETARTAFCQTIADEVSTWLSS